MPLDVSLDLESLLQPIDPEQPGGPDLREADSDRYYKIQDLRDLSHAAEKALLQADEDNVPQESAKWAELRRECIDVLSNQSKHLWVATWLIEAQTHLGGFDGLHDALEFACELVDRFWGQLHPAMDEEDGYLQTVSRLGGLGGSEGAGTLIAPLRLQAILPADPSPNLDDFQAYFAQRPTEWDEASMKAVASGIPTDALRQRQAAIEGALEKLRQLGKLLDERCGNVDGEPVAPSFARLDSTLSDFGKAFRVLTEGMLDADETSADGSEDEEAADGSGVAVGAPGGAKPREASAADGVIRSREEAFKVLKKVSNYFRKTEPHSPLSYMVDQTLRFGNMELPDLLRELINDSSVLERLAERTGVQLPEDD